MVQSRPQIKGMLTFSDSDTISAIERRRIVRALFNEAEAPLTWDKEFYHKREGQEAISFFYEEGDFSVRHHMEAAQWLNLASSAFFNVPQEEGEQ